MTVAQALEALVAALGYKLTDVSLITAYADVVVVEHRLETDDSTVVCRTTTHAWKAGDAHKSGGLT